MTPLIRQLTETRDKIAEVEPHGMESPDAKGLAKAIALLTAFTLPPFGDQLCALVDELERAVAKHPAQRGMTLALNEEVGEVAKAFLEGELDQRIQEASVQVACVAIRIAARGDESHNRVFQP